MKAEIISIGTELLLGQIVNTNAAYLAQKLASLGVDLYYQSTVGDNPQRLSESIRKALGRSDIVILSGGLGPTVDDITAATVARTIGQPLVLNKSALDGLKSFFKFRKINIPAGNDRQAYIPRGSRPLRNRVGTAPGIIIEIKNRSIICLPGPPRELCPMFEESVAPYIVKRSGMSEVFVTRTIKTVGVPEAKVNRAVKDLLELPPPTTVGIYAKLREVHLVVMAKAKNRKIADRAIAGIENKIRARLGRVIFGYDDDTLESAVGAILIKKKMTIAVAESCTGGLISSRLTDVSGSSKYFIRGAVPYSNDVKVKYVGVSKDSLKKYGAVSRQVALELARGIRNVMGVDIGLGVTGIAGPDGGTVKKPVGLVYVALAKEGRSAVKEFRFSGSRQDVKWHSSQAALDMIRRNV
jgi:nicotinamide-nucleotide amidase